MTERMPEMNISGYSDWSHDHGEQFYIRETDGAMMVEVAPHCYVAAAPAQALGLISRNKRAEVAALAVQGTQGPISFAGGNAVMPAGAGANRCDRSSSP